MECECNNLNSTIFAIIQGGDCKGCAIGSLRHAKRAEKDLMELEKDNIRLQNALVGQVAINLLAGVLYSEGELGELKGIVSSRRYKLMKEIRENVDVIHIDALSGKLKKI